ncbi:MAG: hypothetical protein NT114_00415 [Patescibacteria group bacterium]|nr:hypothetical protein [Patescibacteria group bacterium]
MELQSIPTPITQENEFVGQKQSEQLTEVGDVLDAPEKLTQTLGAPPSFEAWKASRSSGQQSPESNMQPPAGPPKPPSNEDYNKNEGNDAGDPNDNLKPPSDEKNEKPTSPDLNKLIGDANSMALKDRSILLDLLDHSPEKEQEFAKLLNMYDNMSEKDQEYFKNHLKK